LNILENPVVFVSIFIDIIVIRRRIFAKRKVLFLFSISPKKEGFFSRARTRICISNDYNKSLIMHFFFLYYVCHLFSHSRNTNRIHLRVRSLIWLQRRKKEEEENYTECLLLRSTSLSSMIDEFLLSPIHNFLCSLIH
jgi:hypothetical protein